MTRVVAGDRLERLVQIRSVLPARDWNALYQQDPIADESGCPAWARLDSDTIRADGETKPVIE